MLGCLLLLCCLADHHLVLLATKSNQTYQNSSAKPPSRTHTDLPITKEVNERHKSKHKDHDNPASDNRDRRPMTYAELRAKSDRPPFHFLHVLLPLLTLVILVGGTILLYCFYKKQLRKERAAHIQRQDTARRSLLVSECGSVGIDKFMARNKRRKSGKTHTENVAMAEAFRPQVNVKFCQLTPRIVTEKGKREREVLGTIWKARNV